jgi:hypothetical protein
MYGLDPEIDLSFFIGTEVIQVCIAIHQIQVHLDEGISLSIEGAFQYVDKEGNFFKWDGPEKRNEAASICSLLGMVVSAVEAKSDGTLTLKFSGRQSITILDDDKQRESYQISRPGMALIVV